MSAAQLPGARDHTTFPHFRPGRNDVGKRVEGRLRRGAPAGSDIRAGDRVLSLHEELPLREERLVALVEGDEARACERGGGPQLDGAERLARTPVFPQTSIDPVEP